MPETPNHGYNVPSEGTEDWHVPLNDNFEQFDTDVEIRDTDGNKGNYDPAAGAKFLATDTGVVYVGDGSAWEPALVLPRFSPASSGGDAGSVVFGHHTNAVASDVDGATISGGGLDHSQNPGPNQVSADYGTIGGGHTNGVNGYAGTVAGGISNETDGVCASVCGGIDNTSSSNHAAIGGGTGNTASHIGAFIGGGSGNEATGGKAVVGGGVANTCSGYQAIVGGGNDNTASGSGSTIGGGGGNVASSSHATVAGGASNEASEDYATIPGGYFNEATGRYSFAAGNKAKARADGAFVWGDSSNSKVASTQTDEFKVQAGGGAVIFSASDHSTGVHLPPGSGSWTSWSSRAAKEDFAPVAPETVLERVNGLDLQTWTYRAQDDEVRHMGPMAEEFAAAFGLGPDDEHISNVDADGVALAAIQGVSDRVDEQAETIAEQAAVIDDQRETIEAQEARLDDQAATIDALAARVERLEAGDAGGQAPVDAD